MTSETTYCYRCGRRITEQAAFCRNCGAALAATREQRITGTAFVLNEIGGRPIIDVLTLQQRTRLETHYEAELAELTGVATARSVADLPAPPHAVAAAPATRAALPRRAPRPAPPPREPMDWSWLAEQQANLFLFAGAFLTVIAALIYVGYSGQAVDGALKMTLLTLYTLAFLAAGVLCLRFPRVEIAGRIFFAIGAILVPLNFMAARTLLTDEDLSMTTMWLTGSVVTAAFYTCVAYLGVGRVYSFGGGVALVSAALAGMARSDMPIEWTPVAFIALAGLMSLTNLAGPAMLRSRIGSIWSVQANVVAVAAMAFAILLSTSTGNSDFDESLTEMTRWFLPLTFAGFTLYALPALFAGRRVEAAVATIAGFSGTFVTTVYATHAPAEYYAYAFAALAVLLGAGVVLIDDERAAKRLPSGFDGLLHTAAFAAAAISMAVAVGVALTASPSEASYTLQTRWFLPATFVALAVYGAIPTFGMRRQEGALMMIAGVSGAVLTLVYALRLPAEDYALAAGLVALMLGLASVPAAKPRFAKLLPEYTSEMLRGAGVVATLGAATVALFTINVAREDTATYELASRWFATAALALVVAFYALLAVAHRERGSVPAFGVSVAGLAAAIVFGFDLSAEYYAFALIAPAILLAAAPRWTPEPWGARLPNEWQFDALVTGRVLAGGAAFVAIVAAFVGLDEQSGYEPAYRAFLPVALALVAAFFAIDTSITKRAEIAAAFVVATGAAILGIAYAAQAQAEWYGVAFAATGVLFAFGGRVWSPAWLDARVRDGFAAISITLAWLPFEGAYADAPRIGAAVHMTAAFFYAMAAIFDDRGITLDRLLDVPNASRVRISAGWLYAAGVAGTFGYLNVLHGLPGGDADAGSGALAYPLLSVSIAMAAFGVAARRLRPDFRMHLYVMSLLVALISLAAAPDALALAVLLSSYVAISLAVAAYEDEALLALPGAVFGFAAVAAWRQDLDAPFYMIPIAFSLVGVLAAAAVSVVRTRGRWPLALGGAAATYAIVAPIAGFAVLATQSEGGYVATTPFFETGLYEWSTVAVAVLGLVAVATAAITQRRAIIVPATAVLALSVLLQIGRFNPENSQAYTLVIGAYLLLLGLLGLWKFKLIPELNDMAPFIEGAGAAFIMLPSFVQSIDAGWRYEWILLAEASTFFAIGVVLRRRGVLAAALLSLVLVGGRALFDAVNALPNWIIVMAAGMALLGIGMGILLGRDRWSSWQRTLLGWWDEAGDSSAAS